MTAGTRAQSPLHDESCSRDPENWRVPDLVHSAVHRTSPHITAHRSQSSQTMMRECRSSTTQKVNARSSSAHPALAVEDTRTAVLGARRAADLHTLEHDAGPAALLFFSLVRSAHRDDGLIASQPVTEQGGGERRTRLQNAGAEQGRTRAPNAPSWAAARPARQRAEVHG